MLPQTRGATRGRVGGSGPGAVGGEPVHPVGDGVVEDGIGMASPAQLMLGGQWTSLPSLRAAEGEKTER